MGALHKIAYWTEQEYLAFEDTAEYRHEYVDGQIFAMAGANERHNRISLNIGFQLRAAARGGHCGVFLNDMRLRLDQGKAYYYPDVMLVCNRTDNGATHKQQPCFIAEVLSLSTEKIDRREKWAAYRHIPGLRYYLLASAEEQRVEYYVRDDQGDWQTALLEAEETLTINCEDYQAVLNLAAIYEDVVFDNVAEL
jgi:Uma2 family endonuclease